MWIFYIFLSSLSFASAECISDIVIDPRRRKLNGIQDISISSLVSLMIVLLFSHNIPMSWQIMDDGSFNSQFYIALISGSVWFLSNYLFIQAFENSSSTVILPLIQFGSLSTMIISWIIRAQSGEEAKTDLLAYCFLFFGSLLPATGGDLTRIFAKSFWSQSYVLFALSSEVLYGIYEILVSQAELGDMEISTFQGQINFFVISRIGYLTTYVTIALLTPSFLRNVYQIKGINLSVIMLAFLAELVSHAGFFVSMYGYVSNSNTGIVHASETALTQLLNLALAYSWKMFLLAGKIASVQQLKTKVVSLVLITIGLFIAYHDEQQYIKMEIIRNKSLPPLKTSQIIQRKLNRDVSPRIILRDPFRKANNSPQKHNILTDHIYPRFIHPRKNSEHASAFYPPEISHEKKNTVHQRVPFYPNLRSKTPEVTRSQHQAQFWHLHTDRKANFYWDTEKKPFWSRCAVAHKLHDYYDINDHDVKFDFIPAKLPLSPHQQITPKAIAPLAPISPSHLQKTNDITSIFAALPSLIKETGVDTQIQTSFEFKANEEELMKIEKQDKVLFSQNHRHEKRKDYLQVVELPEPCKLWKMTVQRFTSEVNHLEAIKWNLCENCQRSQYTTVHSPTAAPIMFTNRSTYNEFAPTHRMPFILNNVEYQTIQHYLEWARLSEHVEVVAEIQKWNTIDELNRLLAGKRHCIPRRDWESEKDQLWYTALFEKFKQHPRLLELLKDTEQTKLLYKDDFDSYWGCGFNGMGRNKIGEFLMHIRGRSDNDFL